MFGQFDKQEDAEKVAAEKSRELGKNCVAVPDLEDGKWTVAIRIKATPVQEFLDRLKANKS